MSLTKKTVTRKAVSVVAEQVVRDALDAYLDGDAWALYPEIDPNDWLDIVDGARRRANAHQASTHFTYAEAYAFLQARAVGEEA